jgi:tetratricopeptide (TPR) repeat protein
MDSLRQAAIGSARFWGIALALSIAVLVAYGQTWGQDFSFVSCDDADYVVDNPHVKGGLTLDGLRWAMTAFHSFNWHPLTWISLQLDSHLFGTTAQGYHRTNVLLHAANAVLLFWLLRRLTGALWCSTLVAALFALHPTHVESVAWVSERKDVLSALLWLLTMAAYAWYAERPRLVRYLLVVLLFALGLMAKPMLVTLPAVLLLLDYWPLHRWPAEHPHATRYVPAPLGRLVAEKVPLFVLVAVSVLLTLLAQRNLVQPLDQFPLGSRVGNALVSYVKYIGMTLWPVNLCVDHPHPRDTLAWWQVLLAAGLLAVLSVVLLWVGRKRRYLTVGWLWYLGTLVPVIGLVQVCTQALAERYTYIPTIGLFILFAWAMADFCSRAADRVATVSAVTAAALAALLAGTWFQVQYWRDSEALWRRVIAINERNHMAQGCLGLALWEKGRYAEAAQHFERAIQLHSHPMHHTYLGIVLLELDQLDEAGRQLERAIQLDPDFARSRLVLGRVRNRQGRHEDAVRQFTAALKCSPDSTEARLGLASALANLGAFEQSRQEYKILLRAEPDSAPLHDEMGRMYKRQGKLKEAVACYDRAVELKPDFHESWNNKGVALERLSQLAGAADCYRRAVELEPEQLVYRLNLAYVLRESGQDSAAAAQYDAAFRLNPQWPQSLLAESWTLATHPDPHRRNGTQALRSARIACQASSFQVSQALDVLAAAHAELGEFEQAVRWQRKVLTLVPDNIAAAVRGALQERLRLYERRQPYRDTTMRGAGL